MNTEQIMSLAKDLQYAERKEEATAKEMLQAAIEALVQERDALTRQAFSLAVERDEAQADALEQARLCGMGGEREADLLGKVARLERERDALKTELAEVISLISKQEDLERERDALITDRDEWRDATFSANERFKKAEDALWKMGAERDGLRLMEQGLEKTVEQLVQERDAYKSGLESEMKSCDAHAKVVDELKTLIVNVYHAKGRYHSQLAMASLYEACGLPNVKPVSGGKS